MIIIIIIIRLLLHHLPVVALALQLERVSCYNNKTVFLLMSFNIKGVLLPMKAAATAAATTAEYIIFGGVIIIITIVIIIISIYYLGGSCLTDQFAIKSVARLILNAAVGKKVIIVENR